MRPFINLFLYLALPITALSIILASGYFTMSYSVSKAIKLGTVMGFLSGVGFSVAMTFLLLFMRKIRKESILRAKEKEEDDNRPKDSAIDKQFILHMDTIKAYKLVLNSVNDLNMGNVSQGNLRKHEIIIDTHKQNINMYVSKLTEETSQVTIHTAKYSEQVKHIINYIKAKEHSFLKH